MREFTEYPDLPTWPFFWPSPEENIRKIHEHLDIRSILDVGAGVGGVFDYKYWTEKDMERREACDIHWLAPLCFGWRGMVGVDAQTCSESYEGKFDLVQCMECLEHVEDPIKALREFIKLANKCIIITSGDESSHPQDPESNQKRIEKENPNQAFILQPSVQGMLDLGFDVRVNEQGRRQLIAWKYL